jgi:hypothetical protein
MKKSTLIKFSFLLALFLFTTVKMNAQSTADVAKAATAVRLIDNKGTIKYLQSNNGITQIVNTTADKTTTTWQLGGTLTDNTYIDVNGKIFGLNKIDLVAAGTAASTDATDKSVGVATGTATGWTLLVREESTGAIKKLMASELLESGETTETALADDTTLEIDAIGVKAGASYKSRIFVFRNGAKLLPTDFSVATDKVTVTAVTGAGNDAWTIYAGDVFEVQWLK